MKEWFMGLIAALVLWIMLVWGYAVAWDIVVATWLRGPSIDFREAFAMLVVWLAFFAAVKWLRT